MLSRGKERKVLEKMGQGIQEWNKSNFLKTTSKKFVVTSDYLNVVFHKSTNFTWSILEYLDINELSYFKLTYLWHLLHNITVVRCNNSFPINIYPC